jgi:hypothetical protein
VSRIPASVGWLVLTLVFVDEVLACVAAGVYGAHRGGWLLATGLVALVVAAWWTFASPKAPLGGPVVRPVTKVLVFGLATAGLWAAGHPGWAVAFLVFSVVVNAAALHPDIQRLTGELTAPGDHRQSRADASSPEERSGGR